jgi:hypothetical protein
MGHTEALMKIRLLFERFRVVTLPDVRRRRQVHRFYRAIVAYLTERGDDRLRCANVRPLIPVERVAFSFAGDSNTFKIC